MTSIVPSSEVSLYRCAECGHGHDLAAWGSASVHGPLNAKGEIEEFDWEEVWEVHVDSITCTHHPDPRLEKFVDGQWHRWLSCPRCCGNGKGCPEDGYPDVDRPSRLVHSTWWPLDKPVPVSSLERSGHMFTPGMDGRCRRCGVPAGSIAGGQPCPGKGHCCPVVVTKGETETAARIYGKGDRWFCWQPGVMNKNCTEWQCDAGHVVGLDHAPADIYHEKVCPAARLRCPWSFLVRDPSLVRERR